MLNSKMLKTWAALALCALLFAPALAAEEMTLDEVIAANLEARGGAEKIKNLETFRASGTMNMGPAGEVPFTMEWKRPNKMRLEFTLQGQTGIQAYDGESGWMLMPFMGQTEPQQMPAEQAKMMAEQMDIEGPLVNYEEKGHKVEYLGEEEIEGTPAYKVKITRKSGGTDILYIDKEYGLEIKQVSNRTVMGQEIESETSLGDYKDVGGLMVAHSMESKAAGAPQTQVITIEEAEVNVDIPDSDFEMPEAEMAGEEEAAE